MAAIWQTERTPINAQDLIAHVAAMTYQSRQPLSDTLLAMLADISRTILRDPVSRRVPQYVALGYWLRSAALNQLKNEMVASTKPGMLRIARGVSLHLPPTNVDTIFVYSWAMSVLAGNANIVRLSDSLSPDTEWLVNTIAKTVADHGEAYRQIFCTYPYGGDIERTISQHCDLRMIWGGDAKVATVSATPIRPDGLSVGFPDRKSLAIISTHAYADADENARDALAVQFYNDLFWFDQMGCGSPRLLIWVGSTPAQSDDFYARLGKIVTARKFAVETGVAIEKLVFGNNLLADGISEKQTVYSNELTVCRVTDPDSALNRTQGGGFLCEWHISDLSEIPPIITRVIQTITHFGFSDSALHILGTGIAGRGGYRIVPIGQALQFDTVWDGVDLFEHMTRKIIVRNI